MIKSDFDAVMDALMSGPDRTGVGDLITLHQDQYALFLKEFAKLNPVAAWMNVASQSSAKEMFRYSQAKARPEARA